MKKEKLFYLTLLILFVFSFYGCGKTKPGKDSFDEPASMAQTEISDDIETVLAPDTEVIPTERQKNRNLQQNPL